jgi:hypothetical protein
MRSPDLSIHSSSSTGSVIVDKLTGAHPPVQLLHEFCTILNRHAREQSPHQIAHVQKFGEVRGEPCGIKLHTDPPGANTDLNSSGVYRPLTAQHLRVQLRVVPLQPFGHLEFLVVAEAS